MKTILYISELMVEAGRPIVPVGLSRILYQSQLKNREHDITGILGYRKGYYLQVVEGPEAEVMQLMENIKKDPRHRELKVLIDKTIQERSFDGWRMKMISNWSKDEKFFKYVDTFYDELCGFSNQDTVIFENFYELSRHQEIKLDQAALGGLLFESKIKLKRWPNFSMLKPSPVTIEICAFMMSDFRTYDEILTMGFDISSEELSDLISSLSASGLLSQQDKKSSKEKTEVIRIVKAEPIKASFYTKMKNFLNRRRAG